MKTFKDFLMEKDNQTMYDNEEITEIANALDKDCQPFLKAINHQIVRYGIYRGVRGIPPSKQYFEKETIRKDRRSLDTGKQVHKMMDDWMLENLGGRFRSQALFGTNEFEIGLVYGTTVGAVFPIGNFKFAWSRKYNDVYEELRAHDMSKTIDDPEKLEEFMKNGVYTTKNIKMAISSGNELMIMGDNYHFLNLGDNKAEGRQLLQLIGSKLK